jgi:hypothetical protein
MLRKLSIQTDFRESVGEVHKTKPSGLVEFFESGGWRWPFVVSLLVTCIVHLYDLAGFPLGNHDWFRLEDMLPEAQLRAGRAVTAASYLLTWNKDIPLLFPMGLVLAVVTGILSVYYIVRNTDRLVYAFGGTFLAIVPYITPLLFYRTSIFQYFLGTSLAVLSLFLFEKRNNIAWILGAIVCFLSLATYGVVICTLVVLAAARVMVLLTDDGYEWFYTGIRSALGVLIALVLYLVYTRISQQFLGTFYNTDSRPLIEIFFAMPDALSYGFQSLLPQLKSAYVPSSMKTVLLALLVFSVCMAFSKGVRISPWRGVATTGVALVLVLGVKIYVLLTDSLIWWAHRGMLFGTGFAFLVGGAYACHSTTGFLRKFVLVLLGFCLWASAVQVSRSAQHHRLMVQHDLAIVNRILMRIEQLPEYGSKPLNYYQVGYLPSLRKEMIQRSEYTRLDHPFTNTSQHPSSPGNLVRFLSDVPWKSFRYIDRPHGFLRDDLALNYQILVYSLDHPWPDEGSVISLSEDSVLVVRAVNESVINRHLESFEIQLAEGGVDPSLLRAAVKNGTWLQ